MNSKTAEVVRCYAEAFNADNYRVQFKNRITDEGFWVDYTFAQLVKPETIKHLQWRNLNGFDIYARPVGWQYVLLDDLTRAILAEVATLKPCLLMETSPSNFQAWLILSDTPKDRDTAKSICKELAIRFGADIASAEPDHVGRLPGFTNRKEKYQMQNGRYPFVRLLKWEYRKSTFYPSGGAVFNSSFIQVPENRPNQYVCSKGSLSEQDFGVALGLIKAGKTDEQIYNHLISTSPSLQNRKGKHINRYLERTILNAKKAAIG